MTRKILVADSSPAVHRLVELMFSPEGIDVVAVDDGEQAIERVPVERPDVVLADISTPRRDGYEVATFVRNHPQLAHVPVLLLAGAFEPVDDARVAQARCAGVLVKPFDPQQVVARVRSLIAAADGHAASSPRATSEERPPSADRRWGDGRASDASPRRRATGSPADSAAELDEYFDRLDAAFARFKTRSSTIFTAVPPPPAPPQDDAARADVPTLDAVLRTGAAPAGPDRPVETSQVDSPPASAATSAETPAPPNAAGIADLFRALLAAEQGRTAAEGSSSTALPSPEIEGALLERVTRGVIERLGPNPARDGGAGAPSDVLERLVQEEIDRLRRQP